MKVTLTLPDDLLAAADRFVAEHPGATRSAVCAEALREWLRAAQETDIARYYSSLSPDEHAEDRAWRGAAAQSAEHLWR